MKNKARDYYQVNAYAIAGVFHLQFTREPRTGIQARLVANIDFTSEPGMDAGGKSIWLARQAPASACGLLPTLDFRSGLVDSSINARYLLH